MRCVPLFLALFLVLWWGGPAAAVPPDEELVMPITASPPHFNPALRSGGMMGALGAQLFAGLTRLSPEGKPVPYLAENWTHSPDFREFTFFLRRATFHDGTPITADDVVFSILTVKKYHAFTPMLEAVEGMEARDDQTVVFHLSRPFPELPSVLIPALVPVFPRHVYGTDVPLASNPANLAPVGSGPFMLESFEPGKYIRLIRNPHFFLSGRPRLDRITYRVFWDEAEILPELINRELDLYLPASPLFSRDMNEDYPAVPFVIHPTRNMHAYVVLQYNLNARPLSDPKVREALDLALDRNVFCRIFNKMMVPQYGPIPPGAPFHVATGTPPDREKAARLLDEAGYPRGTDGKRFTLTVECPPGANQFSSALMTLLSYEYARIGIELTPRNAVLFGDWADRLATGQFQTAFNELFAWHDPVIGIHRLYSSNTRHDVLWANNSRYANPEVERLLLEASGESDQNRRLDLYARFQKIVTQDHPMLWIAALPLELLSQPYVHNLDRLGGFMSPMDDIYKDGQAAPGVVQP